jgi:hypothetical protein
LAPFFFPVVAQVQLRDCSCANSRRISSYSHTAPRERPPTEASAAPPRATNGQLRD